jgi:septal ring factor EnvC (AmiA/AmiB activator)
VQRTAVKELLSRRILGAALLAVSLCALIFLPSWARATNVESLQAKVEAAKGEAGEIAEKLKAAQGELAAARERAAQAEARERKLSGLLAEGEERAAELAGKVERSEARLVAERKRLRRARGALARRLVSIYESGAPSEASVILGSSDFDELAARTEYLATIQEFDAALATRVEQVRNQVRGELRAVAGLKRRADAYDARLVAARAEVAVVRDQAESAAVELHSIAAARSASLSTLKSRIGTWVSDIEKAEAASRAAAEEEVGRWLGGPFTIPPYIVMCESGGDYGALNASSGAGGAYQILPSTWALYGGQGEPQNAPKAEQDRIAAEIWSDSGGGAWVCAG